MFILACIYAIAAIFVLVRPPIGPFSRLFQLAWDTKKGKVVIVGIFIFLFIMSK